MVGRIGPLFGDAAWQRFQERFARIGEPCDRQPDIYYDVRYGKRAPYRRLFLYLGLAFRAAKTADARRRVVEEITHFAFELIAHARSWLGPVPLSLREVVLDAQTADAAEDVAESNFLAEPTPGNAITWMEKIRLARAKSDVLEMHLFSIAQGKRDSAPLRIAR